ncbi:nucleotidyltransferase family protein [uncultured Prevotella sp.]|uniref:nucleotidyltransferase family protein n=1 Tax=uncultured Prevotella sp. TaxID=159272 RepID=UPI0026264B67|nr:nucleotidyltransferase family protein [uncultured Prevotella sp.]
MKTTKEYISLIASKAEELKRDFGIRSLRIFGSVSRNEQHEGSDVDVCVDMEPKAYMVVRLKRFLEDLLQCSVDVIRLHKHINPYLLDEIDREGIYVIK